MNMTLKLFVFVIFCRIISNFGHETDSIKPLDECENWTNKHVFLAKDVHFYNMTFPLIKIDTLNDLNISTKCSTSKYNMESLRIFAKKNILFDNDLDLYGILNLFNLLDRKSYIVRFENVNGFNENSRELTVNKAVSLYQTIFFEFSDVIFYFYQQGKPLTNDKCKRENFDSKTNFFGQMRVLSLANNVFYNNKICPYVFMNTKLERLDLFDFSDSLIFQNRLEFLSINTTNIKNNITSLFLSIFNGKISCVNLNPFAFKTLKYLSIKGNLEHFDENLFENFKEISFISVKSDDLINFFHRGTKWINSINRHLNVTLNLEKSLDLRQNLNRLVSLEFVVKSWLLFNQFYTFPNEDICLFKNFPHSQLVLPLIISILLNFTQLNAHARSFG
jgi:hypothetical protein